MNSENTNVTITLPNIVAIISTLVVLLTWAVLDPTNGNFLRLFSVLLGQSVQCQTTDWSTGVRFWAEANNFLGTPSLLSNLYRGSPPGIKWGRDVTLTTHLHPIPRSRINWSYIPLPLGACMVCTGQLYFYFTGRKFWYNSTLKQYTTISFHVCSILIFHHYSPLLSHMWPVRTQTQSTSR
jgi:hypothetical protein